MAWVKRIKYYDAIGAIQSMRQDWEGEDLVNTDASIGLTLADMTHHLGLDADETDQALGPELAGKLRKMGVIPGR